MSATGLEVLDRSLQTTNVWLKEIMQSEAVGPDRQVAWRVLGAVLHILRDRLSVNQVAHLGAELPIVIRGLYYDQWHPAGKPENMDNPLFYVRDGIVIIPKNGTIPHGTVI